MILLSAGNTSFVDKGAERRRPPPPIYTYDSVSCPSGVWRCCDFVQVCGQMDDVYGLKYDRGVWCRGEN